MPRHRILRDSKAAKSLQKNKTGVIVQSEICQKKLLFNSFLKSFKTNLTAFNRKTAFAAPSAKIAVENASVNQNCQPETSTKIKMPDQNVSVKRNEPTNDAIHKCGA